MSALQDSFSAPYTNVLPNLYVIFIAYSCFINPQ